MVKINLMSKLLREIESDIGSTELNLLVLKRLITSIETLDVKTSEEFQEKFYELYEVLSITSPKFWIVNVHLEELKAFFQKNIINQNFSLSKQKRVFIKKINDLHNSSEQQKEMIIKNSLSIDVDGKTILIYDTSNVVLRILKNFVKNWRKFKIIIAEQGIDKTHKNVENMHQLWISFQVVPAYTLSHILERVDMIFLWALTMKDTKNFVMSPGSHSIVSEFNVEKIPAYLFINTEKFSLWKSKERWDVFIHEHLRKHVEKDIEYTRIKYSHDRVPVELFHRIVTNQGVFTSKEVSDLYDKKYKEYNIIC